MKQTTFKFEIRNPFKKEYYEDHTLLSVGWNLDTLVYEDTRFENLICWKSGFSICFRKEWYMYSASGNGLRFTLLGLHLKFFGDYVGKILKYLPNGEHHG